MASAFIQDLLEVVRSRCSHRLCRPAHEESPGQSSWRAGFETTPAVSITVWVRDWLVPASHHRRQALSPPTGCCPQRQSRARPKWDRRTCATIRDLLSRRNPLLHPSTERWWVATTFLTCQGSEGRESLGKKCSEKGHP